MPAKFKFDGSGKGSIRSYRWMWVWLGLGAVFALLLLANSIRDYSFVARVLTTQQVRQQVGQHITTFERSLMESENTPSTEQLPAALAAEFATGPQPLWIVLRSPEGNEIGRVGSEPRQVFARQDEEDHFRNRQPLFATVPTSSGEAVVEAFPLRVRTPRPPGEQARDFDRRGPMSIEIAMPLKLSDSAALWPIRRNLIINSAAAFALLLTVTLTGLGVRSYVRGAQLESQLDVARQVQEDLLPKNIHAGTAQVAAEYKPAEEVAGDFYDVFETGRGTAFIIGDVSGKGVPAALLMGVIHGAVRSSKWWESRTNHERETVDLNHLLCERISEDRFATMFWSFEDAPASVLHYVNAGHCAPMLVRLRDGRPEIRRLDGGGPALGMLPDAAYIEAETHIDPGDLLVLYSDGLIEAANSAGEEFGESRLAVLAKQFVQDDPHKIRDAILAAVRDFLGEKVPQDDLTCVVVRFGERRPLAQPLDQRYDAPRIQRVM